MARTEAGPRAGAERGAAESKGRFASVRSRVHAKPGGRLGWRIGVTVLGVAIIAGGLVLLPLPGPGWLIIFAGLGVLATEYTWARVLLQWLRSTVRKWTQWLGRQALWVRGLAVLLSVAIVACCIYAAWKLSR